jgi:hypothetical protein
MKFQQSMAYIKSCRKYKYFYSVRTESSPLGKSPDPAWRAGTTDFFLILRARAGRGMYFFWQISGRAGRDSGN